MRRQCKHCPWKVTTNPNDIPNGYCAEKHAALAGTIADPDVPFTPGPLRVMACHETDIGAEVPCVGWLVNQLRENNLKLRIAVYRGTIDGNVKTVGPQHERFEDTLCTPVPAQDKFP